MTRKEMRAELAPVDTVEGEWLQMVRLAQEARCRMHTAANEEVRRFRRRVYLGLRDAQDALHALMKLQKGHKP